MENKSITYLNSKTWYRLLKVIFILFFLIIITGFNVAVIINTPIKQLNGEESYVICNAHKNSGKEYKKSSLKDIGINIESKYFTDDKFNYKFFFTDSNEYDIKRIFEVCFSENRSMLEALIKGDANIYDIQKKLELQTKYDYWVNDVDGDGYVDSNGKNVSNDKTVITSENEFKQYLSSMKNVPNADKSKFLDFTATGFELTPVFSFNRFIEPLFIGNILIILFYEILKRVFYYIILGTIRPKK